MSIKLQVEDYCQNCPEFEADVRKEKVFVNDRSDIFNCEIITETTVTCEHRDKCAELRKHIERNMKK